jgi:hypothetical protein
MRGLLLVAAFSLCALPVLAATSAVTRPPVACGGCAKIPPTVCDVAAGCWHYGSFYPYGRTLCPKGQGLVGGICVVQKPVHRYGG